MPENRRHAGAAGDPAGALIARYPVDDRNWAETFHASLLWAGLSQRQCVGLLREQLDAICDSDEPVEQLLGDPWRCGVEKAAEVTSPQQLARQEQPVDSGRVLLMGFLLTLGLLLLGFGVWTAASDGWLARSWNGWQLGALCTAAGSALSLSFGWYLYTCGRLHRAWLVAVLGTAASAGAGLPLVLLVDEVPLPNAAGPLGGALLLVLAWICIHPISGAADPESPAEPAGAAAPAMDSGQWLARTQMLLRGRYGFSRSEAARQLAEVREHCLQTGARHPAEQFGTPAEFAMSLGGSNPGAVVRRWWLGRLAFLALVAYYGVSVLSQLIEQGPSPWRVALAVMWFLLLLTACWRLRPAQRREEVCAKLEQRQRRAEAVLARYDNS